MMPDSASGVSSTRCSPKSFCNPSVIRKTPPSLPMSSPIRMTLSSDSMAARKPEFNAFAIEMLAAGTSVGAALMHCCTVDMYHSSHRRRSWRPTVATTGPGCPVWARRTSEPCWTSPFLHGYDDTDSRSPERFSEPRRLSHVGILSYRNSESQLLRSGFGEAPVLGEVPATLRLQRRGQLGVDLGEDPLRSRGGHRVAVLPQPGGQLVG